MRKQRDLDLLPDRPRLGRLWVDLKDARRGLMERRRNCFEKGVARDTCSSGVTLDPPNETGAPSHCVEDE